MIVTLSRQFVAGARTIGRELSHCLGYRLMDEDIRGLVAAQLDTSVDAVASPRERPGDGAPIGRHRSEKMDAHPP